MIKAVIFDAGGVLVENPLPKMLKHYATEFAIEQNVFDEAFYQVFPDWQKGKITEDEFWQRIADKLDCPKPATSDLWLAGFKSELKEHEKVINLIHDLKSKGIRLAILSDTETPVANFLRETYTDFDVYIFSCERGYTKPQKEIYELALNELGVQASETIFIDDRSQNVEGAQKIGIKAILFDNEEQAVRDIYNFLG